MARLPRKRTSKKHRNNTPKPVAKNPGLKNPNQCTKCKANHASLEEIWGCNHVMKKKPGTEVKNLKKSQSAEYVAAKAVTAGIANPGKEMKKSIKTNSLKK